MLLSLLINKKNILNNRLLKLITGTFVVVFLFLLSANITFAQDSNCQHISGNGPVKIVFMKDKRIPLTLEEYKKYADYAISGFSSIEPFKTYFNKFSFYLDTKDRDGDSVKGIKTISGSSCGNDAREYVYFDRHLKDRSYTFPGGNVVYIFDETYNEDTFPNNIFIRNAVIHESAHLIGGLNDEYEDPTMAPSWFLSRWINDMLSVPFTNCSSNPSTAYKNTEDGKIYGSIKTVGCNYQSDMYYRPSPYANIMDLSRTFETSFNVISCGYMIAGIKGENTTKSNAEKYWPECCGLDTIKDGVPGCGDTPTITFPPPEKNCEPTDYTNEVIEPSSESDRIISAEEDMSLPNISQPDQGFFKINGKDVSVPDGSGGKKVPGGQQLAFVPAGGALKIEMSDRYCRNDETIELSAEVKPIDSNSPIKSVFDQSVQAECAIVAVDDYNSSATTTSFSTGVSNIISDVQTNYGTLIDETDLYIAPQTKSVETNVLTIKSKIDYIRSQRKNITILVAGYSIPTIGGSSYPHATTVTDPNALLKVKDWIIANCPVVTATSSLSIDIPAQKNCVSSSYVATTTQASSTGDTVIRVEDDIPLTDISVPDGEVNFFKINGTDVSASDGSGGRKIPKNIDLITIPAGRDITYETGDKYCREGEFSLSLTQLPVTLERPIVCFFNCK
jgi:hypothetical protein